jgi:tRNA nucleotidyltransferase (CCA-adding enzyme)
MESQIALPDDVRAFMETFRSAGYEIFVVGGSLRDSLLKRETYDWDFTTNATPEQILILFPSGRYENSFGTVLIPSLKDERVGPEKGWTLHNLPPFEITPYRTEGRYSDNRHPDDIQWAATVEEDLQRRDFTINALAYDGANLIDTHDGRKDLAAKTIRAVGDPSKRFQEDALRMMRAVRFAAQLGFTIEEKTLAAIQQHAALIAQISWERIRDELLKTLAAESPASAADAIVQLKDTGLLDHIMPELVACFGVEQKSPGRHHTDDVGTHLVQALRHCSSPHPIVRLATLLHDIGKPPTRDISADGVTTFYNHEIVGATIAHAIAERLRLSKNDRYLLTKLVRYHMFSVGEDQTDKAIRRFIRRIGTENVPHMIALRTADRLGSGATETSWRTELYKQRIEEVQKTTFEIRDLAISGQDIMEQLNLKPGPEVGRILKAIFEEVEEGTLPNEREAMLVKLQDFLVPKEAK